MIAFIWSAAVITFRAVMVERFLSAGGPLPIALAISESIALFTTAYATVFGKVDRSWQGLFLPVLHLPVLLFDVAEPAGPDWACGLYLLLVPFQMLLRLRMGLCCTVAVPCFVKLLDGFPYSRVRHPLAVLEMALAALVTIWLGSPWNVGVFALVLVCNVGCVLIEERFLKTQPSYLDYCRRVPFRYVPGVW